MSIREFRLYTVLFFCLVVLSGCERQYSSLVETLGPDTISAPQIGKEVSDFSLTDKDGHAYRLSDFRGNIVFINFWATWCPPCLQEMPYMEALNQKLKAKSFTMVAVSVDRSWSDIVSFFSNQGRQPSFLVLLDAEKLVSAGYGSTMYPETYVIDRKGRLLKKYIGAVDWLEPRILEEFDRFIEKVE